MGGDDNGETATVGVESSVVVTLPLLLDTPPCTVRVNPYVHACRQVGSHVSRSHQLEPGEVDVTDRPSLSFFLSFLLSLSLSSLPSSLLLWFC